MTFSLTEKLQLGLRPLDNVTVQIHSIADDSVLEAQEEGEICVSGPNVMVRYLNHDYTASC